ncbi:MAG: EcsC family protein [Deltaproteobacteria bacterium]|nr:EcsC family protein [Deltaproteobacteria bacterium]
MGGEIQVHRSDSWTSFMNTVLKCPGIKINRRDFLDVNFARYCDFDKLNTLYEKGTAAAGINIEYMDKVAASAIKFHTNFSTITSFALGIPGGFALFGTVPADLIQFYFHIMQLAQKLAYVYGFPDLEGASDDDFLLIMTMFIGLMSGVEGAAVAIKEVAEMLAKTAVKKLPQLTLTKTFIYQIVRQISRLLGVRMTKKIFASAVSKIIPLVGGLVSALITFLAFKISARKLKKVLRENIVRQ